MAEVLSSCSLREGRSDRKDLMTSMHVLLEEGAFVYDLFWRSFLTPCHEGATRNLNGEVKLSSVPKIVA